MPQEFDALKLIRQQQAESRSQFAEREVKARRLRLKRQPSYTFVAKNAETGQAIVRSSDGGTVPSGDLTSNALIKTGQTVRVLLAQGKTTVKQLPKRLEKPKPVQRSEQLAKLKWMAMLQKGTALEFYLCGTRALPKKVYTFKAFRDTLTLSSDIVSAISYNGFTTPYHRLDLSPYNFVFDGVFSSLGAGEDEWLYTFGHSECLSWVNPTGIITELIRRNRFYKLTPQGLKVFFAETVSYGAGNIQGYSSYPSRTFDYYNAGNGFFHRKESVNDVASLIANYGYRVDRIHSLNTYSYIADQAVNTPSTQVDASVTVPPSYALGVAEVITGSINFTPKLKPAQPATLDYALIESYFFDFTARVLRGTDYFPAFQINRQGTAALAFGRYVRQDQIFSTQFLCGSKGIVQAPASRDSPYTFNYGLGFAVASTTQADPAVFNTGDDSVLKNKLARFKNRGEWAVYGNGSYLNSANMSLNARFAATAARKVTEIELYDFEWQLQRTIKVPYYVHKPFALTGADRILQITNASYSE